MCDSLRGKTNILGSKIAGVVAAGLVLLCLCSCGPAGYIYTVTSKASRKFAEAKAVRAKDHAPYEYWSALTYLHMAREKAGDADFKIAIAYGRKAVNMSVRATRISQRKPEANTPTTDAKNSKKAPEPGARR